MYSSDKNIFAGYLGFKNTVEAICCLGPDAFNVEFKKYKEYVSKQTKNNTRKSSTNTQLV